MKVVIQRTWLWPGQSVVSWTTVKSKIVYFLVS